MKGNYDWNNKYSIIQSIFPDCQCEELMLIIYQILKQIKHLLTIKNRIVNYINLILQNVFASLFVKFYAIYLTILGDNYISFYLESQEILSLMIIFIFIGILSYLHDSFVNKDKVIESIAPGIIGGILVDSHIFFNIFI